MNPKDAASEHKINLALVPPAGIVHCAHAMMNGSAKYGPYNWRKERVSTTVYTAAIMRHLLAYQDGENWAVDSGAHHLGHIMGCCAILLDAAESGQLIDDRPGGGTASVTLEYLRQIPALVNVQCGVSAAESAAESEAVVVAAAGWGVE